MYVSIVTMSPFKVMLSATSRTTGSLPTPINIEGLFPTPIDSMICKLTPATLQTQREKGLCYYCDEWCTLGH